MTRTRLTSILAASALSALLAGSALAQDAAQTVVAACGKCHNTKRVCAGFGAKDKAAWNVTVTRMISKGAQVSEKDKAAVVDWLAAQPAGAKPVCE